MTNVKKPLATPWYETWGRALRTLGRWSLLGGLTVAVGGGLGYALWKHVEPHVRSGPEYRCDADAMTIEPAIPEWIRSDIRSEVLRDGNLEPSLSLLDSNLGERVYKAFALHPWIARVERVKIRPGQGILVQLVYRRPVMMVEVPGGLYAVDVDGVLLPSGDFTPHEAARYPRLSGVRTTTESPVGMRWQDAHVQEAARLSALLIDDWQPLELSRVTVASTAPVSGLAARNEYELLTRGGRVILWGSAPGFERSDEPPALEKLATLRRTLEGTKPEGGGEGGQPLDLRRRPDGDRPATTAQRSEPSPPARGG